MPLEYEPITSEIRYERRKVGEYRVENGVAKVSLDITYECRTDQWMIPLSWFDYGLNHLEWHQDHRTPTRSGCPREISAGGTRSKGRGGS